MSVIFQHNRHVYDHRAFLYRSVYLKSIHIMSTQTCLLRNSDFAGQSNAEDLICVVALTRATTRAALELQVRTRWNGRPSVESNVLPERERDSLEMQ